jgi:hypothetical protein
MSTMTENGTTTSATADQAEVDQLTERLSNLEKAQAVQAATQAGAEATQAATLAGAQATQAAAHAGTWSTMAAGAVALVVGMFLGVTITRG